MRERTYVDVWRSRDLSRRNRSSFFGMTGAGVVSGLGELSVGGVAIVAGGVRHRLASSESSSTLNAPSRCRSALPRRLCRTSTQASKIHERRTGAVPEDRSLRSSCMAERALLYNFEAMFSESLRSFDIRHDS